MQPHRLPFHIWVILLVPALTAATQPPQLPEEPVLNELGTRDEEPRIALPEHRGQTPFTTVSQTRRKASQDPLVSLCQQAVDTTTRRMLSTDQHTPWQMMHALLGLREDFQLLHNGQPVSGLEWISEGQVFTNEHWFEKTKHGGRAHPYSVPYAFEGHANQFLAILSMCGLSLDEEFGTADGTITMRDMINHAQMTLSERDEPTWTLWALSRYLPPTATWRNAQGELWSIERLVQIQTAKPMRGAPCGGTHGLFALAHARNVYLRQGKPLRGVWLMAERKIRQHIYTARMQQNSNGTLSSNFFRGRQYDRDFNKRMASAGHILEFLMIALPQKELNQRWVRRAIEATARDLLNNRKAFVKCSPLYHSVNALNIYLDRVNPRVPTDDASEELAATTEPTRTAQRPQPADRTTPGLKSVPATSISQSREKPSDDLKAEATEPKKDDVAEHPPGQGPEASAPAASKPAKSEKKADKAEEGWSATPESRRSKIAVESKGDDSDSTEPMPSADSTESNPNVEEPQQLLPPKERPAAAAPTEAKPADDPPTSDTTTTTTTEAPDADRAQSSSEQPPALMIPTESDAAADAKSGDGEADTESDVKASDDPSPAEPAEAASKTEEALPETSADTKASKSAAEEDLTAVEDKPSEPTETLEPPAPLPTLKETPDPDDVTSDGSVPVGINRQFLDPDLNPNDWLQRFEIESREIFAARGAILRSLQLSPNMAVADVGTGTGLFVGLLSDAVGPDGHVYAIDISPRLVDFVHRRVTAEELDNVSVVRNDQHGLQLGNQKVDRILVCDTYHHFEYHEDMLKSMYRHLRPGGEVILIDFERIPQTSRTWVLEHVRADKQTFREEFLAAGFEFVEEVTVPEFRENYLLRFRRPIDAK